MENSKEFKAYRKFFFVLGKFIKYCIWGGFAAFLYHLALIKNYKNPEDKYYTQDEFLRMARQADYWFWDIGKIFTKPAMSKMLPDRFPGMQYPKVLVLNLKGTLVH